MWKKLSTKNVLGDIHQLEWHQWICLPKPNSLPSKISLNHIQPLERQSYKQTRQRFHNNQKKQNLADGRNDDGAEPGEFVRACTIGRCHLTPMGIFPPVTDVDDRILQILHRHVLLHVLWQAALCLRRIMHWARRIEQEIDRVFQHITGAQQLKGVSVSLCFEEILLMSALDQPIKTHSGQKERAPPAEHLQSHEVEELR